MTNRIEISEYFSGEIAVELVTGIHVKAIIRAIRVITFVHLVDGVPVKEEKVTPDIQFGIKMQVTKDVCSDVIFDPDVFACRHRYVSVNGIADFYCWIVNNERLDI